MEWRIVATKVGGGGEHGGARVLSRVVKIRLSAAIPGACPGPGRVVSGIVGFSGVGGLGRVRGAIRGSIGIVGRRVLLLPMCGGVLVCRVEVV